MNQSLNDNDRLWERRTYSVSFRRLTEWLSNAPGSLGAPLNPRLPAATPIYCKKTEKSNSPHLSSSACIFLPLRKKKEKRKSSPDPDPRVLTFVWPKSCFPWGAVGSWTIPEHSFNKSARLGEAANSKLDPETPTFPQSVHQLLEREKRWRERERGCTHWRLGWDKRRHENEGNP